MKTMKKYEKPAAARLTIATAGIIATSFDKTGENVDGSDKTRHESSSFSDYSSDIWGGMEE